jgi:hemerythrin
MPLITWDDSYRVHVRRIDEQHRLLVDLLNRLHDSLRVSREQEEAIDLLDTLVELTSLHCHDEEKLLRWNGIPGCAEQMLDHNRLLHQLLAIRDQLRAGSVPRSRQLVLFLRKTLVDHIQGRDRECAQWLIAKGIH